MSKMTFEERSADRRRRIVGNRAESFAEAEAWDLANWQSRTPEERLSALIAIRRDAEPVRREEESLEACSFCSKKEPTRCGVTPHSPPSPFRPKALPVNYRRTNSTRSHPRCQS